MDTGPKKEIQFGNEKHQSVEANMLEWLQKG